MPNSGAYWLPEAPGKSVAIEYTGDDANNREIALGDVYHEVEIYAADSRSHAADHVARAHAYRSDATHHYYGVLYEVGGSSKTMHRAGASGDELFQGLLVGNTAVKLGSDGTFLQGTNRLGYAYVIIAKRHSVVG